MKMILEEIWMGTRAEKVFLVRLGNLPDAAVLEEVHTPSDIHHHAVKLKTTLALRVNGV